MDHSETPEEIKKKKHQETHRVTFHFISTNNLRTFLCQNAVNFCPNTRLNVKLQSCRFQSFFFFFLWKNGNIVR